MVCEDQDLSANVQQKRQIYNMTLAYVTLRYVGILGQLNYKVLSQNLLTGRRYVTFMTLE